MLTIAKFGTKNAKTCENRQRDNDNRKLQKNCSTTLSRINFCGYVAHATIFS